MSELVFEVTQESDGGFVAECLTEAIFTQALTWAELRSNVQEAVAAFFGDRERPGSIRLHLVRDEVLATGGSCRVISAVNGSSMACVSDGAIGAPVRSEATLSSRPIRRLINESSFQLTTPFALAL